MTKVKLHMDHNVIDDKRFDDTVARIANYYEDELYDEYENAIVYYANKFDLDENFIEDAALDYFHYGPDCG